MKNKLILIAFLVLHLLATVQGYTHKKGAHYRTPIRIGILAKRGETLCTKRWGATEKYLNTVLPEDHFHIVPLSFDDVVVAAKKGSVDFFLTNPAYYVLLEHRYGARRLTTLTNLKDGGACITFGGVIFTRSDRKDIVSVDDLRGKTFMAVDQRSFGGWLVAKRELLEKGFKPEQHFRKLLYGNTHDAVVMAVLEGRVDAGTVRTGTLEKMVREGRISLDAFRIINNVSDIYNCPFLLSTRIYPEWPLAKAAHTNPVLAKKVSMAFMNITPDMQAACNAGIYGWGIPDNYQSVHECLKIVKAPPYEKWGTIPFTSVFKQYGIWLIMSLAFVVIIVTVSFFRFKRALDIERQFRQGEETPAELKGNMLMLVLFLLASTLSGGLLLSGLSTVQKLISGFSLHPKGFIIPISFGGTVGLVVGYFFYRLSIQKEVLIYGNRLLHEKRKQYKDLFDLLPGGAELVDLHGSIVQCSRKSSHLLGYEQHELQGASLVSLLHPDDRSVFEESFRKMIHTRICQYETRMVKKDGGIIDVILSGNPIVEDHDTVTGVLFVNTDITGRKAAEQEKEKIQEQLNHTQKMNSIGLLAGGIAHDFNNMLGGIVSAAQLLQSPVNKLDKKPLEYVDIILRSADRASALIAKLLAFSRKGVILQQAIDVHDVIHDIESILKRTIDKKIVIRTEPAARETVITGNLTEVQNAIMNLAVNASQAMPAGGELSIVTNNRTLTQEQVDKSNFELVLGLYVSIEVSDTGCGIPEENLNDIFDPFFTTKKIGEGTGLGLSAVYGTMVKHKGSVHVKSEQGRGTVFTLLFPCTPGQSVPAETMDHEVKHGTGTVLLVDDEEVIRKSVGSILSELGYQVITASDGTEAIEIYDRSHAGIDIIITDIQMPGMGGGDAFLRFREINPRCKVIITTGYTSSEGLEEMVKDGLAGILYKPFKDYELSSLLARLLPQAQN